MAKKKGNWTSPNRIEAIHGIMRKSGVMKHRGDKRRAQKERNYDQKYA